MSNATVKYRRNPNCQGIDVKGRWHEQNLFIPDVNADIVSNNDLYSVIRAISQLYPGGRNPRNGTLWVVVSYVNSITGQRRPEQSHAQGMAVDLAPMASETSVNDATMKSIRLSEKIHFLANLATKLPKNHPAIFAEGDHLHIESSMPRNVVASYHTYRPAYTNDRFLVGRTPIQNKAYKVHPDGHTTVFIPRRSYTAQGRLRSTATDANSTSSSRSRISRTTPSGEDVIRNIITRP